MSVVTVVGDYQPSNETHVAIARAVEHSAGALDLDLGVEWVATDTIVTGDELTGAEAIWISSGGPYRSFEGSMAAIRWARTTGVPLLGTCAGFQHAVIEFARNVVGLDNAHHAEYETGDTLLVVDELACSLAGLTMDVTVVDGTAAHAAYGAGTTTERYYCRFGLNPEYLPALVDHGLVISGTDAEGEPRIAELADHPFFVVTLFVPQTSSTPEVPHPIVSAFVAASQRSDLPV